MAKNGPWLLGFSSRHYIHSTTEEDVSEALRNGKEEDIIGRGRKEVRKEGRGEERRRRRYPRNPLSNLGLLLSRGL